MDLPDFLKKTMSKILGYFKGLTKGQKARLIVFAVLAVVILAASSVFLNNQKSYAVLYSEMEPADAGEMLNLLSEMGVDAKAKGSDTILVESTQADTVRMQLAAEGYPKTGFNFDIFSNASGLGMTDMERRVYYQFQLQENLSKVIKQMDKVENAIVNISLAEESSFVLSSQEKPASASVLLRLKPNQTIGVSEVRAIAELVSKSISGLRVEDVRIVDSNMKLYSIEEDPAQEPEALYPTMDAQLALQQQVKNSLQQQVINLLAPVFGKDSVTAEVSVTLDFDKKESESVTFSPPVEGSTEGLAVSMRELAETIQGGSAAEGAAGIDPNGGNTAASYPELSEDEDAIYNKVSRETNLEINETRTKIQNAQGRIRDLSVAVALDSSVMEDDYTSNVQNLVANAIGVSTERVSVEMLPFVKLAQNGLSSTDVEDVFNSQKDIMDAAVRSSTIRLLIIAATVVLVLIIVTIAVVSLFKKTGNAVYETEPGSTLDYIDEEEYLPPLPEQADPAWLPEGAQQELSALQAAQTIQAIQAMLQAAHSHAPENADYPEYGEDGYPEEYAEEAEDGEYDEYAEGADEAGDFDDANGEDLPDISQKLDASLLQLGKFIERSPESVANLLRNWLSEEK